MSRYSLSSYELSWKRHISESRRSVHKLACTNNRNADTIDPTLWNYVYYIITAFIFIYDAVRFSGR